MPECDQLDQPSPTPWNAVALSTVLGPQLHKSRLGVTLIIKDVFIILETTAWTSMANRSRPWPHIDNRQHRLTQRHTHIHGTRGQLLVWCVVLTDSPSSPWHPHCFAIPTCQSSLAWGRSDAMSISPTASSLPFSFRGSDLLQHEEAQHPPSPCLPLVSLPHAMQHRHLLATATWASALAVLPSSSCLKRGRRIGTRQRDALDLGRSRVLAGTPPNATWLWITSTWMKLNSDFLISRLHPKEKAGNAKSLKGNLYLMNKSDVSWDLIVPYCRSLLSHISVRPHLGCYRRQAGMGGNELFY